RSMAARCASASSRAVNSLRRNPSCAAAMVSAVRSVIKMILRSSGLPRTASEVARGWSNDALHASFDHLGDDEIIPFPRGRVSENGFRIATVGHDVLALLHEHGRYRGHRLDAGHIDFVKLLDESEDRVQFALQMLDLVVVDRDAREVRDVANGLGVDRHALL